MGVINENVQYVSFAIVLGESLGWLRAGLEQNELSGNDIGIDNCDPQKHHSQHKISGPIDHVLYDNCTFF